MPEIHRRRGPKLTGGSLGPSLWAGLAAFVLAAALAAGWSWRLDAARGARPAALPSATEEDRPSAVGEDRPSAVGEDRPWETPEDRPSPSTAAPTGVALEPTATPSLAPPPAAPSASAAGTAGTVRPPAVSLDDEATAAARAPTPTRVEPTATPTPKPGVTAAAPPSARPAGSLPFFGASLKRITPEYGLAAAQEAGVNLVRHGTVRWNAVEPVRTDPPTYRWGTLKDLETDLVNAAGAGIEPTVLILFTPDWAQELPGVSCGPIREDALPAFAQFLQATVKRYSQPPYNVRYWELFNEPDVDPSLVPADSGFGCWGDQKDPLYGGGRFARMLKVAYPAIKEADPQAQVILGGLLLDWPDRPSARFLEGVLKEGGGDVFDLLAFHAYTYYVPGVYSLDTLPEAAWGDRGGPVVGKTAFLRDVLADYKLRKGLYLNEAGIASTLTGEPTEDYRQAQADYVTKLYARGLALDLAGVVWYGWRAPGWRQMELLLRDLSPTPGYHAFAFAVQQLQDAGYVGPTSYAGIEGYRFARGDDLLEVVWSADGQKHELPIEAGRLRAVHDSTGRPVPYPAAGRATLDVLQPLYLELAP